MKKIVTTVLAIFFLLLTQAQTGTIYGKITDSSAKKPLALTTVTIYRAIDTVFVTYRLSNDTGAFRIPNLPFGTPLRLLATYAGFEGYRQNFTLSEVNPSINFGILKMVNTAKQLDEVIVFSERPPVVFKQDTIEFNASAFKTLPTALLEDLLKKLPGVQVDENGNIMVNGQRVNRILVDGKRFFGDDPKMATRNLPSNLVDKVQVMNDKEEIALNNDGDLSNIGKVINLTLKKSIKKALFGKVYAGEGISDKHEMGGIVNTFKDTLQLSILAYSNNINQSGFTLKDIGQLGGFNRSGVNSMAFPSGTGREGGFTINGLSFGGSGNGLNTSTGAGFNLNHTPSKKVSFFTQYFYNEMLGHVYQQTNIQKFFGDTIQNYSGSANTTSKSNGHSFSIGGNFEIDSLTFLKFTGSVKVNKNDVNANGLGINSNNKLGMVSNLNGINNTNGSNNEYSYNLSYSKTFAHKKTRSLSVLHLFNQSKNPTNYLRETNSNYLVPTINTQVLQQLRSTDMPNTNARFNINYRDILSTKITLRINEQFSYINQSQQIAVYSKHAATGFYDSLNTPLSNDIHNEQIIANTMLGLGYRINKLTINFGANQLEQWINNYFAKGAVNSRLQYSNLLFNGGIYWKRLAVSINQDVITPNINYLNPLVDNSNPFYIVKGNPNLLPTRHISLNANNSYFDEKNSIYYGMNFSFRKTNNAIIQSLVVNSSGVQVSSPINVNDVKRFTMYLQASKQFKKQSNFQFSIDASLFTSIYKSPMEFNLLRSETTNYNISPSVNFNMNWHDVIEFNPSIKLNQQKNTYTNTAFSTVEYAEKNIQTELVVRLPKKMVWQSNLAYSYISNLAPGIPNTNVYWNASLTLLMLKDNKAQLKFAVYDILNRNTNITRLIAGNTITDNNTNVLQRYFMLTYSYNIRTLSHQKTKNSSKKNGGMFLL